MLTQAVDVVGNPGGEGSLVGGGPVVHNGGVLELVLEVLGSEHDHALCLTELGQEKMLQWRRKTAPLCGKVLGKERRCPRKA